MSEVRALIEQLVSRGLDPIEAAEIVTRAAIAGAAAEPRSSGAIRQERYRRNNASRNVTRNADAAPSPDKEIPPTPPKETNPNLVPPSPPKGGSSPAAFEGWYRNYPHKVQRGEAERAFPDALRQAGSVEALNAGLERYVASKPADRPWLNPATWLRRKSWLDEPAALARAGPPAVRIDPTRAAAQTLMDQLNAVSPSEIEGHHPPPRLVAIGGRSG